MLSILKMQKIKLLLLTLLLAFIVLLSPGFITEAKETGKPEISIKYVNKGTGVKITVEKTEGAEGYYVYLKGCGDSYSEYMSDYAKTNWKHIVAALGDGTKRRSYTIKGLPKGTYTIRVAAYVWEMYDDDYGSNVDKGYSEKTIKIKAAKGVSSKSEKKYDFSKAKVGDTIVFGRYEQDGDMTNGEEDIEWIILSKSKNQMMVLSKYALDYMPYNKFSGRTSWEDCTCRKWLNESFYKTAFTKKERSMIKKTKIKNSNNEFTGAYAGNDTKDKVFLLSLDEVLSQKYNFSGDRYTNDAKRLCAPTTYAELLGVVATGYKTESDEYTCHWLLRSPGGSSYLVAGISGSGYVDTYGFGANYMYDFNPGGAVGDYNAIRPAIVISLK